MKYKVGQKVRINEDNFIANRKSDGTYQEDAIYVFSSGTVVAYQAGNEPYLVEIDIASQDRTLSSYYESDLEPLLPSDLEPLEEPKMKYKVGQKVRIIGNHDINGDELYYQSMIGEVDTIERVDEQSRYPYYLFNQYTNFLESDLEPVEEPKTLDNLQPGDELYNDGNRITVLAKIPAYTVRYDGGHEGELTTRLLKDFGYVIAQDTIKIDGKTYKKQAVMQALSNLEEIK